MRYPPSLLINIWKVNKRDKLLLDFPSGPVCTMVLTGGRGTAPLSTEQLISAVVLEYLQQPGTKFGKYKKGFIFYSTLPAVKGSNPSGLLEQTG